MNMERERQEVRRRLEEELEQSGLSFDENMRSAVLKKAVRKNSFWNKQIVIPVPAALLMIGVLAGAVLWGIYWQSSTYQTLEHIHKDDTGVISKRDENAIGNERNKLVTIGGYTFYESELTKRKGSPS